jgi:hypothetical protein
VSITRNGPGAGSGPGRPGGGLRLAGIPAARHAAGHALVLAGDGAPAGGTDPDDFRLGWQGP